MKKRLSIATIAILFLGGIYFYPKYKVLNHTIHLMDEDRIVENFRNFDATYPVSRLKAAASPHIYPKGKTIKLPKSFDFAGKTYDSATFLKDSWTTGLLVIQNDTIVLEEYYLGNTPTAKNISWSVAKSFISALMGIAVEEGHIRSIMQNVEEYVPRLKGTAYEGVRIKDVLQMSTGVKFNEDYGDYDSDINRWARGFAMGGSQNDFPATLEREHEPGTVNHYVSINTHVLSMILANATGRTITDYMQEKLYTPLGMENDGYWVTDNEGTEMALGGLNLSLRDYAKIGSLFLHNGNWKGQQIVPQPWVKASVTADAPHLQPGEDFGYGYQWWLPRSETGEFMAVGIHNQNIYINPTTNTVIVKLSANPRYNERGYVPSNDAANVELFRTIVRE